MDREDRAIGPRTDDLQPVVAARLSSGKYSGSIAKGTSFAANCQFSRNERCSQRTASPSIRNWVSRQGDSPALPTRLLVADVHAAEKADFAVDDDDLAVGAEVQQAKAQPEARRIEARDVAAGRDERAEEGGIHAGADAVHEHPNLDAGPRALDQEVADASAGGVVVPDVELEVDVVAGRGDVALRWRRRPSAPER